MKEICFLRNIKISVAKRNSYFQSSCNCARTHTWATEEESLWPNEAVSYLVMACNFFLGRCKQKASLPPDLCAY